MSLLRRRGVRLGLVLAVTAAVVAVLVSHRGMARYGAVYGFEDVAVGATVYAAVGHAETRLTVRRVWVDTVGPIEATPVRCPDERLGSLRSCPGGPLPLFGVGLDPGSDPEDVPGDAIVVLAVTRTGADAAAVCGLRILHSAGWRVGLTTPDVQIELAPAGGAVPGPSGPGLADQLCT